MKVFVSSQAVSRGPASDLIQALRDAGAHVEHSPINPRDGGDARWGSWYANLRDVLAGSDVFVAVLDEAWDSSSWLATESEAALHLQVRSAFWNPSGVQVAAAGVQPYLSCELPRALESAVLEILGGTG